jgi:hypothetical protein
MKIIIIMKTEEMLHFAALYDQHIMRKRPVVLTCLDMFQLLDNVLTLNHLTENNMLAIKMFQAGTADEKLAAIGVRPGVCHGHRELFVCTKKTVSVP